MPFYNQIDPLWIFVPTKVGNWKAGMLSYSGVKGDLGDLHLIASKPSSIGRYSDGHVTFVNGGDRHHIYYQLNNGVLVGDYIHAPHDERTNYWLKYPGLRATAETELKSFIAHWRVVGRLDAIPSAVD